MIIFQMVLVAIVFIAIGGLIGDALQNGLEPKHVGWGFANLLVGIFNFYWLHVYIVDSIKPIG